ncbi:MAG: aminodeoxychorismate synthase component I [Campylobacterota bacterium]|nr:aminodeoxychorismate synthase component I [Campylobacterota bacterium]
MNLKEQMNFYGSKKEPFLFVINYDMSDFDIITLDSVPKNIKFQLDKIDSYKPHNKFIKKFPISFEKYKTKFNKIQNEILNGNTYLANLTTQTPIESKIDIDELYNISNAKFKLYYKDKFICFSPERFCKIENNKIYTYPMKGTIDASIENAQEIILNDKKELAEHTMVVDLLRNDLSIVSKKVKVEKFRYCEKIKAGEKELLQISSKISGQLENNWQDRVGEIITSLLPAGSITGTPKRKTIEILKDIEDYDRGYFTGVFGVFNGEALDSSVIIRYIEKNKNNLIYKSGGGITSDSDINKEYQEMIDKVYIP